METSTDYRVFYGLQFIAKILQKLPKFRNAYFDLQRNRRQQQQCTFLTAIPRGKKRGRKKSGRMGRTMADSEMRGGENVTNTRETEMCAWDDGMSLLSKVGDFDDGRTRFLSSFRKKGEKGGGGLLFEASIYAKSCTFEASVKKEEGRGKK